MKRLPLGISDYKQIIEENYYYVDKTLLIKELLDIRAGVMLLPRPRRFGKTLNLSMLRYFFEKTDKDTTHLFTSTAIWQYEEYRKFQGQYPVISVTFKDVKEKTWDSAYNKMTEIIAQEFERHRYLLENLPENVAQDYKRIMTQTANQTKFEGSLSFLSRLLHEYYNKRVIILIDEYDTPVTAAYNENYYTEMIGFMRSLLTSALKDSKVLELSVVTGIYRVAKESIFSGLNNLTVGSVMSYFIEDKFGFTQSEVKQLLKDQKLSDKLDDVRQWYNGYMFGNATVYNPWSIVQCAFERGLLKSYWLNTSDNKLIQKLLERAPDDVKSQFELLLMGQSVNREVSEAIIFPGIENDERAIWSLLLFSGYLTYTQQQLTDAITTCDLIIPNKEVKVLYTSFIRDVMQKALTQKNVTILLKALAEGDVKTFAQLLQHFVVDTMSSFDFSDSEPEKSYHLFILGLLVYLHDTHEIKSNRESGYGRYDIMIIPRAPNKLATVIEFKKVEGKEKLETACQRALDQIKNKEYVSELRSRGIKKIQLLGIAFKGKKLLVKAA